MKLLDKQVLRDMIGPFVFGVMAFSSVFFAGTYMLKLTNWIMNGMSMLTAAEIVLLLLPGIVVYTLPMATLLAVLMGVGRLSGDSEVVALYASGISLYRIAVPVFVVGVVVSGFSIATNELIAPLANAKYEELQAAVLQQEAPNEKPFTVRDDGTNSRIDVNGGMNLDSGVLRDVTVTRYIENRPIMVIYARRAVWTGMKDESERYRWKLYDGWWQILGTDSPTISTFAKTQTRELEIQKTLEQFSLYQKTSVRDTEQLSFSELSRMVTYVRQHPDRPWDEIREIDVDRWNKLALPMSSLVFALLAAPLGIRPHRSSSGVGFGLSILLIFVYWMVWHYTSSLAVQGNVPPPVGAFAADVVGIAAAIVLLRRAAK